jgi:outer membrane protein assembly factor BamB
MKWRFLAVFLLLFSVPAVSAAEAVTPFHRALIKPSIVRLQPGGEQKFKVVVMATRLMAAAPPQSVKWSVNNIPGGNTELGTIDAQGLYRAPAKTPVPYEVHICGDVLGSANRYVWGTVLLGNPDPAYKMIGTWGEATGPESRLKEPHGISVDLQGNLLIADQGAGRIFRYSKDGKFLAEIGSGRGAEDGQFTEPRYATVDASGNIFVTDLKGDRPRLQVFDPQGKLVRIFAEKGMKDGMILRGHGLWFDSKGRLFATDVDNMRVIAFDASGKFLFCWGKDGPAPGDFNAPHGLYLDANDDVFVNGYYGPTQKYTTDGHFLFSFAHGDPPEGSVYFHSMTGDRWGNAYVTVRTKVGYGGAFESNQGKKVSIAKYNNNGDFICNLSLSVPEHTESWCAVDHDGTIYALYKSKAKAGVEIFRQQ